MFIEFGNATLQNTAFVERNLFNCYSSLHDIDSQTSFWKRVTQIGPRLIYSQQLVYLRHFLIPSKTWKAFFIVYAAVHCDVRLFPTASLNFKVSAA